ncbi:mannitol dehydrogenase family protein [Paradevosia shaoguanensis]|uniref:mannitol dehydrogenase family protein n=1 Tax=Paradevosia shaoguanensis TaxID=1335043 RepID=UPI001933886C|nr:mannitol dehydrogenase family protein [Paradevosia shaoguanensis]
MPRLTPETLASASPSTRRYAYDRGVIAPGIVHLGIGAFHRAHQAVYVDDLLAQHPEWAIVGASLRRPDTKKALEPQGNLYSVLVRDASGSACRVIGSIAGIIDATTEGETLLELMARPSVRIVSLTVTEKGYCHDPATSHLDLAHPDIVHDLAYPSTPRSAPGFLVEALERRRRAGIAPFTIMSCDNLPSNGRTAQRIVGEFAAARGRELAAYVETVAFPSTMVDRIVPATTDADREAVAAMLGLDDAWPVVTEAFSQWVIEDHFPAGRPPFETVGAQMVEDVEPFERMKLRMLNGSHSTLAYLGYLAGHQYVADAIGDSAFRDLIFGLMTEEVMPTLDMPGTDLAGYRDALLDRFANPALKHRTWQIAMDGSQKLPQRLLGTIRDRIAAGQSYDRLALGVAAWMRYATGTDEKGDPIDVRDPMVDRFRAIAAEAGRDAERLVDGFLGLREVFGTDLPDDPTFRALLVRLLTSLLEQGAAATVGQVK